MGDAALRLVPISPGAAGARAAAIIEASHNGQSLRILLWARYAAMATGIGAIRRLAAEPGPGGLPATRDPLARTGSI